MGTIMTGSIILSILQSILFWDKHLGISVFIFTTLAISFLIYVLYKSKKIVNKKALWFIIPIILLSSTYFLFNNAFFQVINIIAIIILTFIMCIYLTKTKIRTPQFLENMIKLGIGSLEGMQEVGENLKKYKKENNIKQEKIKKIGKSILIVLPIILVVIILLATADSIFANMFEGITQGIKNITIPQGTFDFCLRIIAIIITFFLIAGYLINLIQDNTLFTTKEQDQNTKGIQIESMTINMMLTILNIIYAVFCTIQITSLFTQIGNAEEFNYAQYARQGFFQLMLVSILNFIILVVSNNNRKEQTHKQKSYTKGMSIFILIFTIIIILSAFYRMNLYEQEYGYTYLRLFVYYILATEMILIIPCFISIIGKKIDLLKVSIIIITTMYIVINFSNIDSTIATKNVDRYLKDESKREIDISYLINNTGTDAIPELTKLLKAKNEKIVEKVKTYLYLEKQELELEKTQWQEFNYSKQKAKEALKELNKYNTNMYN